MCILPINIINEKIYVFLWFWFYFLAIVSAGAILYRLATMAVPKFRVMSTTSRCRLCNREALEAIVRKTKVGDWFMFDLLSKNMDPLNYRDLVADFYRRLEGKGADQ